MPAFFGCAVSALPSYIGTIELFEYSRSPSARRSSTVAAPVHSHELHKQKPMQLEIRQVSREPEPEQKAFHLLVLLVKAFHLLDLLVVSIVFAQKAYHLLVLLVVSMVFTSNRLSP